MSLKLHFYSKQWFLQRKSKIKFLAWQFGNWLSVINLQPYLIYLSNSDSDPIEENITFRALSNEACVLWIITVRKWGNRKHNNRFIMGTQNSVITNKIGQSQQPKQHNISYKYVVPSAKLWSRKRKDSWTLTLGFLNIFSSHYWINFISRSQEPSTRGLYFFFPKKCFFSRSQYSWFEFFLGMQK